VLELLTLAQLDLVQFNLPVALFIFAHLCVDDKNDSSCRDFVCCVMQS